jgi:hypothetical protein
LGEGERRPRRDDLYEGGVNWSLADYQEGLGEGERRPRRDDLYEGGVNWSLADYLEVQDRRMGSTCNG